VRRTRMVLSSFSGVLSRLRNTDQKCSSGKECRGCAEVAGDGFGWLDVPGDVAAGGNPAVED
jgi:hypothetical protein